MVKTVGKYDLYGTLGEGAFGKVKYAVNTETNEAVAIKILDKDKIQARNMGAQIKKEISIMKMINHHHIVSVKDVFATSAKIFIVLEFVGGGELFDKIANDGKLPEDKARFYFKQLVEGLEHCHTHGVCHRDLKPENLLLDVDGNLKISDFGFSTLNIGDADGDGNARAELLHTTCGTPNYVAPEVLGKDGYDGKKADVWSCGVILYVLLAGYLPFDENTMAALFQKIKHADYEFPDWFSGEARDLISKILVPDPQKRPKITELRSHPWMQRADSGPSPVNPPNLAAMAGAPPTINTVPRGPPVGSNSPPPAAAAPAPVVHHTPPPAPQPAVTSPPVAPSTSSGHHTTTSGHHHAPAAENGGHHGVNGSGHGTRPASGQQPHPVVNASSAPIPPPLSLGDRVDDTYATDKAAVLQTPHAATNNGNNHHTNTNKQQTTSADAHHHPAQAPQQQQQQQQQPVQTSTKQQEVSSAAPVNTNQAPTQAGGTTQRTSTSSSPGAPEDDHVVEPSGFFCCGGAPRKPKYNKV